MNKPFSVACERNREPILAVLRDEFATVRSVLEIGSGTGQHAVHFGTALPQVTWQTSDLEPNHPGIQAWLQEAGLPNVLPPLVLDMRRPAWPADRYDAAFTANTCHIMAWPEVEALLTGIGACLADDGMLCIYGPFNYGGRFTSESNAQFDASLKAQAPHMGIRDIEAIQQCAAGGGLQLHADHAMPANNRLLVLRGA